MKKCRLRKASSQGHAGRTAPASTLHQQAELQFYRSQHGMGRSATRVLSRENGNWVGPQRLGRIWRNRRGGGSVLNKGETSPNAQRQEQPQISEGPNRPLRKACSVESVRKNRVGLLDRTWVSGTEGRAKDGCHLRLTRHLFLQPYN